MQAQKLAAPRPLIGVINRLSYLHILKRTSDACLSLALAQELSSTLKRVANVYVDIQLQQ